MTAENLDNAESQTVRAKPSTHSWYEGLQTHLVNFLRTYVPSTATRNFSATDLYGYAEAAKDAPYKDWLCINNDLRALEDTRSKLFRRAIGLSTNCPLTVYQPNKAAAILVNRSEVNIGTMIYIITISIDFFEHM